MSKFYVITTTRCSVGKDSYDAAEIVSQHRDSLSANLKASRLSDKVRFSYGGSVFGAIESAEPLEKGKTYPELLQRLLAERDERKAIDAMKFVLDPAHRGGKPIDPETVAIWVADTGMSLDELRERFGAMAQAELDATAVKRQQDAERHARAMAVRNDLETRRSEITYSFPAVRGVQAGRAYYVAQIPYGVLVKLFVFNEEDAVPPQHRAQRILSERRASDIADYVVKNPTDYVLPAITASVSAEMHFEPLAVNGAADRVGILHIPVEATILINDGQHRRKGIEEAIAEKPFLRDETIAVTIFFDQGLERSQQMFADINGKQVKPSSAINALYDRRNPFNAWVLSILDLLPEIGKRIDFENASVAAKSFKLWSLVAFKKFLSILTGVTERNISEVDNARLVEIDEFLVRFFSECHESIPQWADMIDHKMAASDVREQFVIGHAVFLEALAMFARRALFFRETALIGNPADALAGIVDPALAHWERMAALSKIVPHKDAWMWANRCVVLGKMQKTADGVKSTAAQLLVLADIPLPQDLQQLDNRLREAA
ncbi:MAG TPA: DNA sulfur modification protein DndB [Noviherbaspirillum sp.]|nr:DNA sulfur modification protein DndB [Noviherbaspirillum sp.]